MKKKNKNNSKKIKSLKKKETKMLTLHLILSLTYITLTISTIANLDKMTTESYIEFDWFDEDKKSLKIGLHQL